jgi:hypothetical protein
VLELGLLCILVGLLLLLLPQGLAPVLDRLGTGAPQTANFFILYIIFTVRTCAVVVRGASGSTQGGIVGCRAWLLGSVQCMY